ncbi:hypothetical protein ACVGOW_03785 [Pseudonocardia saturnea]
MTSQIAAFHGHRAGRAGLSVEEVADTPFLARLQQETERDRAAIAARLAGDLSTLQTQADDLDPELLRARCAALVLQADADIAARIARYHTVCAAFGRSWRRLHRDRHFAHLGWRCPRLSGVESAGRVR